MNIYNFLNTIDRIAESDVFAVCKLIIPLVIGVIGGVVLRALTRKNGAKP